MISPPRFTSQQSAAIFLRGVSIALSAGAGCGKTFVLTQRFLAGLEPSPTAESASDLHSLVAITFTERAAREMRDRIRAACHERLQNCQLDEVDHWMSILRGLDAARISTIHSFCTSLLRSQAVEAGLDPRFDVIEPAVADTLLRRVVRDTLHSQVEIENDDAVQFVVQFGLERAEELLRQLTTQRFQIDFSTFSEKTPATLSAEWLRRWQLEFVPKLVARFRESPHVVQVLELIGDSPSKNKTMQERIASLRSILLPNAPWPDIHRVLDELLDCARVQGGGGKKDWVSEERYEQVLAAFKKLREDVSKLREILNFREEDVVSSAELACRVLRLTEQTAERYAAAKRDQGVLDFDDLLLHARNLLRDNQNVRHRVAAGIRLLMVDEFQDTDPVQADVVRSLCGAAITSGKLFMVGDRKQSIYRFRRADPTVFTTMSRQLPEAGRLPLNVNFRSQPAILNFVNHLFASAMIEYEPLIPFKDEQISPTPAIEFLFATFDAEGTDSGFSQSGGDEDLRPKAAELRAREADWIARRIKSLLNDETPRIRTKADSHDGRPQLRRTKPGDIVILFRALSNVQEYESALLKYGLDYYLVGGKAFFAQQEVFDLLNLCRYLDDCDDLVGLVGVLRSPFFNLNDDSIHALASQTKLSLHQTLYLDPPAFLPEDQRSRIRFAAEILSELRATKDRIPLSDLLTNAIEQTGYDAALLVEFMGRRKLANLRKLVEMARQFAQNDLSTLKDFVARLQTSVLEETDEEFATTQTESGNVVRLMSIHQSKGLEFPVVIVADIDRKSPPRRGEAVLHPEHGPLIKPPEQFGDRAENLALRMHTITEQEADADETIRLFYVACTRAADYLILSTGREEGQASNSPWMKLVESRFDIQTGLLKGDALLGLSEFGTGGRETVPEVYVHRVPCEAQRAAPEHEKHVSPSDLPNAVLSAEPGDFPASASIYHRDATELSRISVSRLEAIDQELTGNPHPSRSQNLRDDFGENIDFDLSTSLGIIVHEVLEKIDFQNRDSWTDLLCNAANRSHDAAKEEVIKRADAMLARFLNSPIADEFAQAKSIHREIDFLLPWPSGETKQPSVISNSPTQQTFLSGVIDLLVETDAGWHVFDYKTGDFPVNAPEEELLSAYELQLGIYAHAVEKWCGVAPQELSLIVFRPNVRRITWPWSNSQWDTIRTRVDRVLESLRGG